MLVERFPVLELHHDVGKVRRLAEPQRGGGPHCAHARRPVRGGPRRVDRGGLAQRRVHLHREQVLRPQSAHTRFLIGVQQLITDVIAFTDRSINRPDEDVVGNWESLSPSPSIKAVCDCLSDISSQHLLALPLLLRVAVPPPPPLLHLASTTLYRHHQQRPYQCQSQRAESEQPSTKQWPRPRLLPSVCLHSAES